MRDEGILIGAIGQTSGDKIKLKCTEGGRLKVEVHGSEDQLLQQRPITYDLWTQLRTGGVEYDARDRNWFLNFATDSVSVAAIVGAVWDVNLIEVLGAALTAANPVIAGIYDVAGNRMPAMDVAARPGFVDVIDRAARLVGIVYGESAQLQQGAPSDAYANPANALEALSFLMGWEDGTTQWKRVAIDASGRLEIVTV